jgi:ParB/RepB/Spo0J family partition protein
MSSKSGRFRGLGALAGAVEVLRPESESVDDNVEMVPLARIRLDPKNPRGLGLDGINPQNIAADDPAREEKLASLEKVENLAQSIRQVGLRNAIEIYAQGDGFLIATGERRFLATRLLDQTNIRAKILPQRPAQLRLIQLIENDQREPLSLARRFANFQAVLQESDKLGTPIAAAPQLGKVTGLSKSQAYVWWSVLRAPADVVEPLLAGAVTLEQASDMAGLPDAARRAEYLRVASGEVFTPAAPVSKPGKRGPKRTAIALGKTQHPEVVRRIVSAVAGEARAAQIAWKDWDAVTAEFARFVHELEDEVVPRGK